MNNSEKDKSNKNTQIKAIIFDMVGVLLFPDYTFKNEIVNNVEKSFNHINDEESILKIKQEFKLSDLEIANLIRLIPAKYLAFDELFSILPILKNKYKLAVINNGPAITLKYFKEKFKFDSYFDLFINSTEVGIKKPDPVIFQLTCEKLKVNPEECLFVDDNFDNITSAKNLGMEYIWWSRNIDKNIHLKNLTLSLNL